MRHWGPLPAAHIQEGERFMLLALRAPIDSPLVLSGTGTRIWHLMTMAGPAGVGIDSIAEAAVNDLGSHSAEDAERIALALAASLDDLVGHGLAWANDDEDAITTRGTSLPSR